MRRQRPGRTSGKSSVNSRCFTQQICACAPICGLPAGMGIIMSEKTSAEVLIGGKVYTLSGYEGEDYLRRVAAYINNKIGEFNGMEELRSFSADMKAILIHLNIADDYFKAKARAEKLEQELELKEQELYDLKHDLISEQIKAESDEKAIRELERENRELQLNKAKLEAGLEDALLGKVTSKKKT